MECTSSDVRFPNNAHNVRRTNEEDIDLSLRGRIATNRDVEALWLDLND